MSKAKERQLERKLKIAENKLAVAQANLKVSRGEVTSPNTNVKELTKTELNEMSKAKSFIKMASDAVTEGNTISYATSEQIAMSNEQGLSFGEKLANYSNEERRKARNVNKFLEEWGK